MPDEQPTPIEETSQVSSITGYEGGTESTAPAEVSLEQRLDDAIEMTDSKTAEWARGQRDEFEADQKRKAAEFADQLALFVETGRTPEQQGMWEVLQNLHEAYGRAIQIETSAGGIAYAVVPEEVDQPSLAGATVLTDRGWVLIDHAVKGLRTDSGARADALENLDVACQSCNYKKNSKTLYEYINRR